MEKKKVVLYGLLHAACAVMYVGLVALVVSRGKELFGTVGQTLGTMAFLLLFVVSAVLMGLTIFGRPILWYLGNRKLEALSLIYYTLIFLIVITALVFLGLVITR
ncbi:MAG: hypothetical protein Q8R20_02390 [Nanoarchaeota archaeon]|nr:hypothetical protein [Nanoarchaeota archaeon]